MQSYRSDLTGMKFGKWTVLGPAENYTCKDGYKWTCQCECGTIRDVQRGNLMTGDQTSCGCDSNKDQLVDLTGQKFKKLTVIQYDKQRKKWLCQCECGNTVYKRSWDLRNGKATTCGCVKGGAFRRADLLGVKCGHLIPTKYLGKNRWECQCDCGKTCIKTTVALHKPEISCGCQMGRFNRKYSIGDKVGKLTVVGIKANGGYLCKCECGNEEEVQAEKMQRTGECSKCTSKRMQDSYDEKRIDLLGQKFGDLTVIGYKQDIHKWVCKCQCGNVIDVYGQHLRVGDTRSCGCKYGLSNGVYRSYFEQEVCDYIKSIYSGEIVQNNRGILGDNYEIDIYLPEKRLGIEIDGSYWHSDENIKDSKYHQNKTIRAAIKNVHLVHIFEYEWRDNQVKIEQYLKSLLKENTDRYYARKLQVCEITADDTREILNKNHLQGYAAASVNIGIKDGDKLLGVMTFGTPRFNKNCDWELIRLCYDSNVSIVGGTQKMFKYFLKHYNPSSIISYSNLAKFGGGIYLKLGFKLDHISDPGYVWLNVKKKEVLTRYQTQKHKLVLDGLGKEDQTEDEIMKSMNYLKIYDCGNEVFIWRKA